MSDNLANIRRYEDGSIDYRYYLNAGNQARSQEITSLSGKLFTRYRYGWRYPSLPVLSVLLIVLLLNQTFVPV